jgi:mono/diheme cytochrome c family protein
VRPALPVLLAWVCLASSGCDLSRAPGLDDKRVQNGDVSQGRALIADGRFGCAACHAIPGVHSPKGVAGPPLRKVAERAFIAGQLPNKPEVLVAFLRHPPALVAQTGMPDVGLTADQARDIAAYLYTLESVNEPR